MSCYRSEPVLAGEIRELDSMSRALGFALAAADALFVIYDCEIVHDRDSPLFAAAHTEAAAKTAVGAFGAYNGALFVIGAGDYDAPHIREELYNVIRARLCAETAADAFSCIYVGNSVFKADSSLRTYREAIAQADTPV